MPGQPKVYGAPLGAATSTDAPDRNVAKPATDEQVKLAYQAYMRQVIAAAHAHFSDHLQKQQQAQQATAPSMANPTPGTLGSGLAQKGAELVSGRQQQIDTAVRDAGG